VKLNWHAHNDLTLLINGEAFYPAVLEAVAQAHNEILIETCLKTPWGWRCRRPSSKPPTAVCA